MVGFDISSLGRLDILQGLGCFFVVVKRRQQARLHRNPQLLHLRRVHIEILAAEGTHAHELHLTLEEVDDHRQLIHPGFPEDPPPGVHPVVVGELPALLKALILQHIRLEILGIGIHRPELVHADDVALVAHARQFYQEAGGRLIVPDRILDLLAQQIVLTTVETFVDDLEPRPIHPSEQFHPAITAVRPFRHPHIEPARRAHFRKGTVPDIMQLVNDSPRVAGKGLPDDPPLEGRCPRMTADIPLVHQHLARLVQEGVQMPDPVQGPLVDDHHRMLPTQGVQRIPVVGVEKIGTLGEGRHLLLQPGREFLRGHAQAGIVDTVQILISGNLVPQFRPSRYAYLRVVLRNVLLLVLEPNPGAVAEKAHQREQAEHGGIANHRATALLTAAQTVSTSSTRIYGCIGSDRTRSHSDVATGHLTS